jgi:mRNA-degrading endonuclease RelE of RelBE toxin-antitoxin system
LTRNGEPEAVLVSVDDLEGLEMTLEILGDTEAVARISESLAALGRGEPGADLATRVGKPLFGPLAGCHGALRGTYRIVYRIEENTRTVHILDIDHRAGIYRPHS